VWLSVADYVVYRLTGQMATDPTLAARTYAFRIQEKIWDEPWLARFGFDRRLFPEVLPSGTPAGSVTRHAAEPTGLPVGARAAVAGHDHICAMLAAGVVAPGPVLDSMGTAESLIGVLPHASGGGAPLREVAPLVGEKELDSGLAIVPHVLDGRYCWLGGLPASGGSVEWLRRLLAEEPLGYAEMERLAEAAGPEPTGIMYFPYLSGSGAPCPDGDVLAAFVGLNASHGRAHLVKALMEGTSYEVESIRRAAEGMTGGAIGELVVVGGGAKSRSRVQIKADITGCRCSVPSLPDATVLGAGLTAALGVGLLDGADRAAGIAVAQRQRGETVLPDRDRHQAYRRLYEERYLSLQGPLRRQARWGSVRDDG
jgi:xylulokinase